MLDTSPLTLVVERFADRLRATPQSRLQRGAAAEALELARELAVRAQRLESAASAAEAGAAPGAAPARVVPDAGIFVVGDQVAVAGLDLAEALRATAAAPAPDDAKAPSAMLDEAVRLVEQAEIRAMR
ncbi:hypothetical protein ACFWHQ_20350 [Streptomyces sp. NPDC060334]|uniref:hypothetical protein n=1 Tax=unclassified Streptomyces TaxID=2593676 RepID=UPI002253DE0E|nr:hypothetical protein [Streptomyces sp. NBC_00424]MCX5075047.1 hypothetical protein [Streptomyces sp. NBC_00424]WUD41804.1 hypothetical protein OHA84_15545 [Streptomyces sp. NBC_00513]